MSFPKFYQIVDDVDWLERFLPLGLKLVQLRIKDQPQHHIRQQIRSAKALCDDYDCQLIINDYWREAIEAGCDFVHLGQEDLADAELPAIKSNGLRLGISTHDGAELQTALAAEPDYIALGPVYPTILKAMKWAPQGLQRVRDWKSQVGSIPLVAIGGLSIERAPAVFDAGADIISVVTDVLLHANPEQRLQQWLELIQSRGQ